MNGYLVADLSWDTRKIRVVGKGRQVFDSFKEWSGCNSTFVSVVLRKISI